MKLYRPLKSNLITQGFGPEGTKPEMLAQYQEIGLAAHNGIDYWAKDGEDICFNGTGHGLVKETSLDNKAGLGVVVFFESDKKYYKTIYWHLKEVKVKVGDLVESGDVLGTADSTGWSTGTHLHFGLKECNDSGDTINKNNGYGGAIDPTPYITNTYIKDFIDQLISQLSWATQLINALKKLLGIK
jgi:murein DD-endopeptidase MepM/ murein hydrolase activator NlpD